jgi:hypothetical protein
MLHGIELNDLAETHEFGFAERFFSQEFIELLQEATVRGDELGVALPERDKMFSLEEKVFHRELFSS